MEHLTVLKKKLRDQYPKLNADNPLYTKYTRSVERIDLIFTCKPRLAKEEKKPYDQQYKECIEQIPKNIKTLIENLDQDPNLEFKPHIDFLKNIINPQYLRGPPVNFSIFGIL